jgi:fermentation-respiration switch protein FrsA (DUF1100 family)
MNFLLLLIVAYVVFALLLRWREPSMIYYPTRPIEATPPRYEEVYLTTSDGEKIHGWFVPASSPFTILFFHGNAGNISHRLDKLDIFRELGANVFIIDYRGYGRSTGKPTEQGTYRDAEAAYEYLTKTRRLSPKTIIVYGESLGSAVAVELATRVPVGGVIMEEPFTSVGDVGRKMFPFMPVQFLVKNKYDTLSKIGRINAPLLIFHSRGDEIFPFEYAERLLSAAKEPKCLVELTGNHNDAFYVSLPAYRQGLREFLQKR